MKSLHTYKSGIIIFFFALLVRLIYNFTVASGYYTKTDAALYNHIAYNIVYHHCYCLYTTPNISRPPLMPFLISVFYLLTKHTTALSLAAQDSGPWVFYTRLVLCILDSITCLLIYVMAYDIFGRYVGLLTGLLAAIYTGLFIYTGWLYTEALYTFFLTLMVFSLYRLQQQPHYRWLFWAGLSCGLAMLTRPNGPVLFGMLLLWSIACVYMKIRPWKTVLSHFLMISMLTGIIIAPWLYRNYLVTHTFVLVSLGSGDVLIGAYNDTVLHDTHGQRGLWVDRTAITPPLPEKLALRHDNARYTVENEKNDTAYALHWIQTHLDSMPYLLSLHFINMWVPYTAEPGLPAVEFPHRPATQLLWTLMYIMPPLIFVLAALGFLVTLPHKYKTFTIIYIALALTIIQNVLFYGNMRFRAPIEPLLVLLAGGTIWWLTLHIAGLFPRYRRTKALEAQI